MSRPGAPRAISLAPPDAHPVPARRTPGLPRRVNSRQPPRKVRLRGLWGEPDALREWQVRASCQAARPGWGDAWCSPAGSPLPRCLWERVASPSETGEGPSAARAPLPRSGHRASSARSFGPAKSGARASTAWPALRMTNWGFLCENRGPPAPPPAVPCPLLFPAVPLIPNPYSLIPAVRNPSSAYRYTGARGSSSRSMVPL